MRISTSFMQLRALNAVLGNQASISDVQQQVATGKRILSPAFDPVGSARALDLSAFNASIEQFQRNIQAGTSRLGLEENALTSSENILQRVRELSLQGINPVLNDGARADIARELQERLDQLVQTANSRDANGEFLFAGNQTRTQPFVRANAPGVPVSYVGDQGQRMLAVGPAGTVASGDPGSDVFMQIANGNGRFVVGAAVGNAGSVVAGSNQLSDPSAFTGASFSIQFTSASSYDIVDSTSTVVASGTYAGNQTITFQGMQVALSGAAVAGDSFTLSPSTAQDMFTSVQQLIDALRQPIANDNQRAGVSNTMNRALEGVDNALGRIIDTRAKVGARLNAMEQQQNANEAAKLQIAASLSAVEDVDLTEAASRLSQQLGTLEASQQSFVRIQGLSLFNFLR